VIGGPYYATNTRRRAFYQPVETKGRVRLLALTSDIVSLTMWDLDPTWLTYGHTQLAIGLLPRARRRAGASGGGRRRGPPPTDRAHPAGQTSDKPPDLARRGREVITKTQKLRPALSCSFLVNPSRAMCSRWPAHFGATSGVCDGGVVRRTDHHNAGESRGSTQHHDRKVHHASAGGW
jgi:hypothetical protein